MVRPGNTALYSAILQILPGGMPASAWAYLPAASYREVTAWDCTSSSGPFPACLEDTGLLFYRI